MPSYIPTSRPGTYKVHLSLKSNFENELGQSKARAAAQFNQLESRLARNPHLRVEYLTHWDGYPQSQ